MKGKLFTLITYHQIWIDLYSCKQVQEIYLIATQLQSVILHMWLHGKKNYGFFPFYAIPGNEQCNTQIQDST